MSIKFETVNPHVLQCVHTTVHVYTLSGRDGVGGRGSWFLTPRDLSHGIRNLYGKDFRLRNLWKGLNDIFVTLNYVNFAVWFDVGV